MNAPEFDSVDVEEVEVESPVVDEVTDDAPVDEAIDDVADEPADEPAPVVEEAVELEPFAFNAFKQAYEVPGLRFDKTKNAIVAESPQALDRLKQMLSHGREWEARGRQELVQLRKDLAAAKESPVAEVEQAKVFLEEIEQLMTMPVEALAEWVMNARQNWPVMQAKAERAYVERLRAQVERAQQPPEPDVEQVKEAVVTESSGFAHEFVQNEPWATPEATQKLAAFLQQPRIIDQYVVRAQRDMPELGLRAGQYAIDWDVVRELATTFTDPYRDAHQRTTTVQQRAAQTTKVAQQNAAALATAKKPSPRTAPPVAASPSAKPSSRSELMKDVWKVWEEQQRVR